ncbi:DUF2218 domain-containing protein [Streptomyces sp. W16]|uniref:DUF2218 domain-containing protein n=1 Tax=Streptomyces sp. W16 TaxID=3076631 RepID=UPI00295B2E6A|nr:DUF2218 domain-containing protein [Streptomyces sp. W16]MDV9176697.1 DUF2218 domain-containing protein [Streptomyces sp. W16]
MLTAEARVATERPGRYLVQLCKHFDNKGRHLGHRPRAHSTDDDARSPTTHTLPELRPDQIHIEWTDTDGTLDLPWGRCTLRATPGVLTVHVEADTPENLGRLRDLVTTHLGRFSRRDPLTVEWQPSEVSGEAVAVRQGRGGRARFVAIGVVVIAVAFHLALGGAVLTRMPWTGWVASFLVTIVAVKAALAGGFALRRHKRRIE